MEKFVLWFGSRKEEDFKPAINVLHRTNDEIIDYHQFSFCSLLTVRLPNDRIQKSTYGSKIVVQIGDFSPVDGWTTVLESDDGGNYNLDRFAGNGIAFIVDSEKKELNIVVEPWGRRIAYYTITSPNPIVSNEMKGIIALDRSIATMNNIDEVALATYIGLHQSFGSRTIFKSIKLIRSGSVMRFNNNKEFPDSVQEYRYFKDYNHKITYDESLEELVSMFQKTMTREVESSNVKGLFLSGGLDSGLLLCALPENLREGFHCVNFGNDRVTDVKRARSLVKLIGGTFCFYELFPEHIMGNNAFCHIWLVEGQSPSPVAFMELIALQERIGLMTGNPGDFNLGGSWADKLTSYSRSKGDLRRIARNMVMRSEYLDLLLGKEKGQRFLKHIEDAVTKAILLENGNNLTIQMERFVLKNRVMRSTNFGIATVREHVNIEEPYFTDEMISYTLQLPIHLRSNRKLQFSLIEKLSPEAAQLSWFHPHRKGLGLKKQGMEFVSKIPLLRTIGRKILYRKMAAEFEDSYVPINTWVRESEDYRNFIEDLLLSPRTRSRNIFNYEGVSKLFKEHISKQNNHMKRLINLVDLEIFFRLFIDGDGFENPPVTENNMKAPKKTVFPVKTNSNQ